jgi:ferredoxin
MTYVICEPCIDLKDNACGVCEPECPVEAIFMEEDIPGEWEHFTQINADYFQ